METLPTLWFGVIALLWTGYLLLEGFDLGVGMHLFFGTRREDERRVLLNTIGPLWDGNEVWLITAGAATFAAFPLWYASLLSTLYVPFVLLLLALILRAVSIEYRGKIASRRWTRLWDAAHGMGSVVIAFVVGAMLALTLTGLPIDANGDRVGGPFAWVGAPALIGGLAVVGFALVHGAVFLGLKSEGAVRDRARRFAARWLPAALLPLAAGGVLVQLRVGEVWTWSLLVAGAVGAAVAWIAARRGAEIVAFSGVAAFGILAVAATFGAAYPVVLPSTLDSSFDLTVTSASSSPYTLGVMSVVAVVALPIVLAAQAWSYWVFRRRIGVRHIPAAHDVRAAVRTAGRA